METIHDPAGVIDSLQARIQALEAQLQREKREAQESQSEVIRSALRRLRLHGVVPLHVGKQDLAALRESVGKDYPLLSQAIGEVWMLSAAPVDESVKTSLQEAANFGNNRWF